MANYLVNNTQLTSVANAIRSKGNTNEELTFPDGFISAVQNISTSGGATPSGGAVTSDSAVIFIDYDGSIVATKTKTEINTMTADSDLPVNPTHEGLTSQGWNWTVTQLKAQLAAMPDQKVYVGQMYVTTSGKTEIDVEMQEGRLDPILTICVNGEISVDWGDSITPDTVTGSSESTKLTVPHSYASAGNYTISISVVSGSFSFNGASNYALLGKNTTQNENYVYSNCVKQIRVGNGITSIQQYAFQNCHSLTNITIPSSVTSIGNYAFQNCHSLTSITIPGGVITNIANSAFYNCYSLASISIPSGITNIGGNAIGNCYSLVSIAIPSSVTSIGNSALQNCYSLASIIIPNGVTSIGSYMFYNCYSIASITIPSGVTSVGTSAFQNCYSMASITIPSSVTSIGANAFQNCYSIASITIPSSVTSIGNYAFQKCYSLASIIIPSDVTSIGNSAFQDCYGMSEYHILPTTVPTGGTTMFNNIVSDCVIYVPQGKLSDYKSEANWSTYASYMQEEPNTGGD